VVVLHACLGAVYDRMVEDWVRSVDAEPEGNPIFLGFIERLRAFGFKRFFLYIRVERAAWMTDAEFDSALKKALSLHEKSGLPGVIDSARDNPAGPEPGQRVARILCDLIKAAPNDVVLNLQLRTCFLPREVLWRLVQDVPEDGRSGLMYGGVFPWEVAYVSLFSAEERRRDGGELSFNEHKILSDPPPLPPLIPFSPTDPYRPVMEALLSYSPADWSYELLGRLWREQPALFRSAFHHVGVELTNDDNLPNRLRAPGRLAPSRPVGRMEQETWQALLEGIPRGWKISMDLWDFGEPLLHPEAIGWIEAAAARGLRVDLYTNGLCLDEAAASRLIDSGVDAVFYRLDAATEATYARVNGVAARFSTARENLRLLETAKKARLIALDRKKSPTLAVTMTEMEETRDDVEAFFEAFEQRSTVAGKLAVKMGRQPTEAELLQEMQARGHVIEHTLYRHDNLFRGAIPRAEFDSFAPLYRTACRQLYDGPYILWTGDVLPCREDLSGATRLGHVREGLVEVWRNQAISRIFAYHEEKRWADEHFCKPCREWYYPFC